MPKLLRALLLACFAVYSFYVCAMNLLLSTPLGRMLANMAPEVAAARWDSAWTWYPFRVHARGFYFRYQDGMVQLEVTADKADLTWVLWPIFTDLCFKGKDVYGENVVLKIRTKEKRADLTTQMLRQLPPIEGFQTPIASDVPWIPPDDAHYNLVAVELLGITAVNVSEVWVNGYRLQSSINVTGGFFYKPFRKLRIDDAHVVATRGRLSLGADSFADDLAFDVRLQLDEMNVEHFALASLAGVDAQLSLRAHVQDVEFLNYYLRELPQVRLRDGSGALSLDVTVDRGRIEQGSHLNLDTKRVEVVFPYLSAAGSGRIRWDARDTTGWLTVTVKDLGFVMQGQKTVVLSAPTLTLTAQQRGLQLAEPMHLDLVIDLPNADSKNLAFLNTFIPLGTGVAVREGRGHVRGSVELSTRDNHGRGSLQIDADRLVLQQKDATLGGKVSVRGVLKDLDLRTGAADFSGSTLGFSDVVVQAGGQRIENYWAKLGCSPCKRTASRDVLWRAGLSVTMKDLFPLMRILSRNLQVPWVLQAFSSMRDLSASADLVVAANAIDLGRMQLHSTVLDAEGNIHIVEVPGKKDPPVQEPYGAMLVRFGAIKVGVELNGQTSRAVLLGAEDWFNAHPWGPLPTPRLAK